MKSRIPYLIVTMLLVVASTGAQQTAASSSSATAVPQWIKFSGVAKAPDGKPLTGIVGITFALYGDQQGGSPLWLETQNVQLDPHGNYTVQLGATQVNGLPAELFATGEARWVGVQISGQAEQPRTLLLSVPYAMKAVDAETVGGLPPSAFVRAALPTASGEASSGSVGAGTPQPNVGGSGSQNYIPIWTDNSGDLGNSVIYQAGTNVGINTAAPGSALDVTGKVNASTGFNLGGKNFAFGSYKYESAFLGFAGNPTWGRSSDSTGVGYSALHSNRGNANTAVGTWSLLSNTNGSYNTAIGWEALQHNSPNNDGQGNDNTAAGVWALGQNTEGNNNTAAGLGALYNNSTGSYNTALGVGAGPDTNSTNLTNAAAIGAEAVVSESNALVLGCTSGLNNCPAAVNVGIGTATPAYALDVHGTGNFTGLVNFATGQSFPGTATLGANTFTGNQTVNGNVSATGLVTGTGFNIGSNLFAYGSYANYNAFLGFAGNTTTTGSSNTASGVKALYSNTTGYQNTASGNYALYSNTTGNYNTADGDTALYSNTTGYQNTASGDTALYSNTTGYQNTASGFGTLAYNTTGYQNTASGDTALYSNTTGNYNTANGFQALYANATGNQNTANGFQALYANTTGVYNTASGAFALASNTTGYYNTASGWSTLYSNTTGYQNTAAGLGALDSNTTGINNTAVGFGALSSNTTGNDLTCIGFDCSPGADGLRNATAIGAHAVVGESNALVLGGAGSYAVKVGIGTTTPSNVLTIAQGAGHPLSDGWETFSSRRWKTNIHTLHGALGKVEQLRGVSYDLKESGKHEVGVIAEEVGAVVPEVVTWEKDGKDARSVDYGRLTALLIEATKEQQTLIHKQQEQIRAQQAQIARLGSQVKAIQASLNTNGRSAPEVRTVSALHQ